MFEETLRGDDVVARIAVELVPPTRPDPGLTGEMGDHVGAIQRRGEVSVHQAQFLEGKIAIAPGHLQVVLLLGGPVVAGEAAEASDSMAAGGTASTRAGADNPAR